jgi:hypothetical protein
MVNWPLHEERARMAWPFLVKRARNGKDPYTYAELGREIGVHWRPVGFFLGIIQRHCREAGLPRLQALAVNSTTRVPGEGYAGPRGPSDHRRDVKRVQAHKWPINPPKTWLNARNTNG